MKLKEKDYAYIIVFLILLLVGIFTFYYGSDKNQIVSYLGFAGTITSLILSVVALIYTFYQSTTSITQAQKITEASEKLNQAIGGFHEVQNQISSSVESMKHVSYQVSEMQNQISASVDSIVQVSNQVSEMDTKVSQVVSGISKAESPTSTDIDSVTFNDIVEILQRNSINGLLTLLLGIYQSRSPKKEFTLGKIIEELNTKYELKLSSDYSYGFLIGFNGTKLIKGLSKNNEEFSLDFIKPDETTKGVLKILDDWHAKAPKYIDKVRTAYSDYYEIKIG
ncbi:hypothetical protein D7Z26_21820 [Cohnella endophytica]|uniref:Uncharacterized protein n=1 Tax=Cohnella endophytica TaxID=2419778 RepID=A0A494XGY2_9BACL|nr:hypothetical protein [Cohnella endophytica]RKP47856.1 hypothetical protein D7Z26_21820 [Cohnella endophytica]